MAAQKLGQSVIVDAALAVADREGLERVSMRKVAAEIGAAPMALYRHVASKKALLDAMLARVVERVFMTPETPEIAAREARQTFRDHPNWLPLLGRPSALENARISPELLCFTFGSVLVEQRMKDGATWSFDDAFERGLRAICTPAQNLHVGDGE